MHETFQIRDHIWQIQEAAGVYFTIIQGTKSAIVMDTGYGIANTRDYVERLLSVPYIVINSHGHPDHTQGNDQFDKVYIHPLDLPAYESASTRERRAQCYDRLSAVNALSPDGKEAYAERAEQAATQICPLAPETVYDLGNLTVRVVELPGHTKGSVGLLVEEERLLLAGDAFNPDMWMFADNHDTLDVLAATVEKALGLPFDTYLGGHSTKEVKREFLQEVKRNLQERTVDWDSYEVILGKETYKITYTGEHGTSRIAIPKETALKIREDKGTHGVYGDECAE